MPGICDLAGLAECKISVVIGMDKKLIKRAIIKKYKDINGSKSLKSDQELAEVYLEKIIQLTLDLPDPGIEETRKVLRGQLGVLTNRNIASKKDDSSSGNGGGKRKAHVLQNNAAKDHSINISTETEDMGHHQKSCVIGCINLTKRSVHDEGRGEDPAPSDGNEGKPRYQVLKGQPEKSAGRSEGRSIARRTTGTPKYGRFIRLLENSMGRS